MTIAPLRPLPTRFMGARLVPRLQLASSGFLLNSRDGETFSLNETGRCLLLALLRGVPPIDVWRVLPSRFEVSELQAQRDAQLFLARLFDVGLLELPPERPREVESQTSDPGRDEDEEDAP
ncbi:MAG TPA: PqqD family protein [Pseudomonadota bacterium]|nr:PqqD family protein [Pseudomonadota bacterium]